MSSVRSPERRSSSTLAPNRLAPTPSPVSPAAYASRPAIEVPKKAQNRVQVSITPPQLWLNVSPSSCGNVSKKCRARVANVAGR